METKKNYLTRTVISGPMFSGKTELLLEKYAHYPYSRRLLKPVKDVRDGKEVLSRSGIRFYCEFILEDDDFPMFEKDVVPFVDEAQFLSEKQMKQLLENYEHSFICGLSVDFKGNPFPSMELVKTYKRKEIFCTAQCACGRPAYYNRRLSGGDELVHIGHDYAPECEACFRKNFNH